MEASLGYLVIGSVVASSVICREWLWSYGPIMDLGIYLWASYFRRCNDICFAWLSNYCEGWFSSIYISCEMNEGYMPNNWGTKNYGPKGSCRSYRSIWLLGMIWLFDDIL